MTTLPSHTDLQSTQPRIALDLDGVGVTGIQRMIHLPDGTPALARIDADVNLPFQRSGVHMSRFHETVTEAINDAIVRTGEMGIDALARRIATDICTRQQATISRVRIEAQSERADAAPATGRTTWEPVTLIALARGSLHTAADGVGSMQARGAVGIEVTGMNACPCAQELVRDMSRRRLADEGFDGDDIERILSALPVATHNQRGRATLMVGARVPVDPITDLLDIARASMSATTSELLKREDELSVVTCAHDNPMFVEDSVRSMLAAVATTLDLADDDIVMASQVNFESIHAHDVRAWRTALIGNIRAALADPQSASSVTTTLEAWLDGAVV